MSWERPDAATIFRAIESYLRTVYGDAGAPKPVRDRVEKLRAAPAGKLLDCDVFECDDRAAPARYALRLGNKAYPHMKLVIERAPDGKSHLFRADTHDRHIRPRPDSKEYAAFTQLMQANQQAAAEVEAAWAKEGIATFKEYLRRDLARRGM
jgi:hypothetical protein